MTSKVWAEPDPEHADAHCNLGDLLEKRKADCHSAAGQPRPSWCL